MFDAMDENKDGHVSRAEFIKGLRRGNTGANEIFGLSTTVHQEDGSREAFERVFQELDANNDKSLTRDELFVAYGRWVSELYQQSGQTAMNKPSVARMIADVRALPEVASAVQFL